MTQKKAEKRRADLHITVHAQKGSDLKHAIMEGLRLAKLLRVAVYVEWGNSYLRCVRGRSVDEVLQIHAIATAPQAETSADDAEVIDADGNNILSDVVRCKKCLHNHVGACAEVASGIHPSSLKSGLVSISKNFGCVYGVAR